MGGGSGGAGLLRTGGDVAQTVGAFLAGRGLRNKRDDLLRAMNDVDNARSQLDALVASLKASGYDVGLVEVA